jgi:hypothetical protein
MIIIIEYDDHGHFYYLIICSCWGESDIRLFRKLFNLDYCKVEAIPGGKFKLEECVSELVKIYFLIIGIRDADFIYLGNQTYLKTNLFLTDLHDMEMILISEDEVFGALIFEFTSFAKNLHSKIRNDIISSIEQVSLLRWLNDRENLEYKFDVGFQDLISFVNLNIGFPDYFRRVISKSPNAKLTQITIVLEKINFLKDSNPASFQLCNGRDFMKALSQFVRENGDGRTIGDENISSIFRMIFTLQLFKKTRLYNEIKSWADMNGCILYPE